MLRSRPLFWGLVSAVAVLSFGCGRTMTSPPAATTKTDNLAPLVVPLVKPPAAVTIVISPALAQIEPGDSGVQLLVEDKGVKGGLLDHTSEATWTAEPPGIVVVSNDGYVRPIKAGKAKAFSTLLQ